MAIARPNWKCCHFPGTLIVHLVGRTGTLGHDLDEGVDVSVHVERGPTQLCLFGCPSEQELLSTFSSSRRPSLHAAV